MKQMEKMGAAASRAKWGMLALVGSALAPVSAFAQSGDFDESAITAKITTYGGKAIVILGAFLLAVWALRAMGILRSK